MNSITFIFPIRTVHHIKSPDHQKSKKSRITERSKKARIAEDIKLHVDKPLRRLRPPEENQNIRDAISKCKHGNDVMDIIQAVCKQACDDPSVYTKAIRKITELHRHSTDEQQLKYWMNKIFNIWDMISQYSELNEYCYSVLMTSCNSFRFQHKIDKIFQEMRENDISPNNTILNNIFSSLKKTKNIKKAEEYWKIHVVEYDVCPNAMNYTAFIDICAFGGDVKTAEKYFTSSEFQNDKKVLTAMMHVYRESRDISNVMKIKQHMESLKIKFDSHIYNEIILSCIMDKQSQEAIYFCNEAIETGQWDYIIIRYMANAYNQIIEIEDEFDVRKRYLDIVQNKLPEYFEQCDKMDKDYLNSPRWGNIVFEAQLNTYKDRFGKLSFELLVEKYDLEYLNTKSDIRQIYLISYSLKQSKFILRYVFEEKIDVIKAKGVNIVLSNTDYFRFQTPTTAKDIIEYLAAYNPPIIGEIQNNSIIYIPPDQLTFSHDEDSLFGDLSDSEFSD